MEGFPLPTVLLLGGLLAGLLLRRADSLGERDRGAAAGASGARGALRGRVEEVAEAGILAPVDAELEAHGALCAALAVARGERQRRH